MGRHRDNRRTQAKKQRRFLRNEDGSISLEGAIAMIFMFFLLVPLIDVGQYISVRIELRQALRAGGQYALKYSDADSLPSIKAVVEAATDLEGVNATVDPVLSCECLDGSPATCGVACTNGVMPGVYMTIDAEVIYQPFIIGIPGLTQNPVTETMNFRVG